jgi:acyl carrier protein
VGIDDSFFDLGGQSLQAMRLCTRLGAAAGVAISMSRLFDNPTVAQLAAYIEAKRGPAAQENRDLVVSR